MTTSKTPIGIVQKVLYSAILLALLTVPCWAQDSALTQPSVGILTRPARVDSARARTACPLFVGGHRDELDALIPEGSTSVTCTVERVSTLGPAAGVQWRVVKYLTRYIYPADSIKRQYSPRALTDTSDVLDVVLYSAEHGDSAWRAEWQGWADRRMTRDIELSLGVHGGLAMFSVLSCVNGTGGCEQHFLGHVAGKWIRLNDRYQAQLKQRFGRNAFWKGVVIDVHTLRGIVPLYSSGDANCCASRELRLTLKVQGTDVVIASAEARRVSHRHPPGPSKLGHGSRTQPTSPRLLMLTHHRARTDDSWLNPPSSALLQ